MNDISLEDVKTLIKDVKTIKLTPEQRAACEGVLRSAKWTIGPKEADVGMFDNPLTAPRFNSIVTDDPRVAALLTSGILTSDALGIPGKEGALAAPIQQQSPRNIIVNQKPAVDYLTKELGVTVNGATISSDSQREIG